jgi:hypothetical protein
MQAGLDDVAPLLQAGLDDVARSPVLEDWFKALVLPPRHLWPKGVVLPDGLIACPWKVTLVYTNASSFLPLQTTPSHVLATLPCTASNSASMAPLQTRLRPPSRLPLAQLPLAQLPLVELPLAELLLV